MQNLILVFAALIFMVICAFAVCRLLNWLIRRLLKARNGSETQISAAYTPRRDFSRPAFSPPTNMNWGGIVSHLLDIERCTLDALLPGGKLGPDLIANAVNAQRYVLNDIDIFAVLRVHHPDRTVADICDAMQAGSKLLQAAVTIPFGKAVITDTKLAARLSFQSRTNHCAAGFAPNPDLQRTLSEKAPGYSDAAYEQAIDELITEYKRYWLMNGGDLYL